MNSNSWLLVLFITYSVILWSIGDGLCNWELLCAFEREIGYSIHHIYQFVDSEYLAVVMGTITAFAFSKVLLLNSYLIYSSLILIGFGLVGIGIACGVTYASFFPEAIEAAL